jgi:aryl-alcohol dehydrogenase-like predicted oxidoreductase
MTLGGAGCEFSRPVATPVVDAARRLVYLGRAGGVNLFDPAAFYSAGASELNLGAARGGRRDDVLLATKLHGRTGPGVNDLGQSRHHIIRAVHDSLRRLGTDWIDILQVHGIDLHTDPAETLRALEDLVRAGTVRYVGCSNFSGWHLMKALAVSEREHLTRYSLLQAHYSLVSRELEHELVPLCLDQGVGILVWSPLAGGFLTGKVRRGRDAPEGSRQSVMGPPGGLADPEGAHAVVEALVEIAAARGVSPAQVALNWLLAKPGVTSLIVGARTLDQLADNLAAVDWDLEPAELARLDAVSAPRLPYPQWHQLLYNSARAAEPWLAERVERG